MNAVNRHSFLLSLLLAGLTPYVANGQTDNLMRWELTAGGTTIKVSEQNGWGFGPSVFLHRHFGHHLGAEFGPTIMVWSDGFYRFGGLSADLGIAYEWQISDFDLSLSIGPSMIFGGDSDGSILALGGGYFAARSNFRPGRDWFGLFARGSVRLWHTGEVSPAATAGVAFAL